MYYVLDSKYYMRLLFGGSPEDQSLIDRLCTGSEQVLLWPRLAEPQTSVDSLSPIFADTQ